VSRRGGAAVRLTSGAEDDSNPSFSPDGSMVAFSRAVRTDSDVYVVPTAAGVPKRLTVHPAAEIVRGWTPDGKSVLFTSARGMSWQPRLYTVPAAGGPSRELPIPIAWNGVFAPDGRVIYAPHEAVWRYPTSWKGYRGGGTSVLALADLGTHEFKALTPDDSNNRLPVWAGDQLLVASDRSGGIYNVFSLDPATGQATQVTRFTDASIGALAAAPDGGAVYEREGGLFLLDPSSGQSQPLLVTLEGVDGPPDERQVPAADYVDAAAIASSGEAAISTRGDILLVDKDGHATNLTRSSSATDLSPGFAPDGARLAYVSFGAQGDGLVLQPLGRAAAARTIRLPAHRGGYLDLGWSPDARHLTVTDLRAGLWLVDAITGSVRMLDQGHHMNDTIVPFEVSWSTDGQWVTYARYLPNNNRAIFLQRIATGAKYQLTGGQTDARSPTFDRSDKRLYFVSSGNAAVTDAFGMYRYMARPLILRKIQAVDLDLSQSPSQLARSLTPAALERSATSLTFDQKDYLSLAVLADGSFLASAREWPPTPGLGESTTTLVQLTSGSPTASVIASNVSQFALASDRAHVLVQSGNEWSVRPLPIDGGVRTFTLDDVEITVRPREEWQQIYREAWRAMRDTFYDPAHHGQDIDTLEARYARYLPDITRRADLTALIYLALGNVSVSHIALDGGDDGPSGVAAPTSGLLGADYSLEGGHYRFARIYHGSPFAIEAPTAAPLDGISPVITPGDYLLAVNGVPVTTQSDVQSYLLGTAGKRTVLTICRNPAGTDARTIAVQPMASEVMLRLSAWVEANREAVRRRSNGSLGYVYVPDYQERGMAAFLREWTAVSDQDGVVIDQRYNPGGYGVDYILDLVLHRPLACYAFRDTDDLPFPVISNRGPRVLLINERNGSAADSFAWMFKRAGVGPLVGHRTAGAGIGSIGRTTLIDGGGLNIPVRAFFNPAGSWDIENHGVDPSIPVELDPAALLRGEDTQLDAAIDAALNLRREHPTPAPRHPPPFVYPR